MKAIIFIISLFSVFSVYAEADQKLIVKYDRNYKSSAVIHAKWNLLLPDVKSGYFINLSIRTGKKAIYDRSFRIDNPEKTTCTVYLDSNKKHVPPEKIMLDFVICFNVDYKKDTHGYSYLVPWESAVMLIPSSSTIQWKNEAVIMELNSNNKSSAKQSGVIRQIITGNADSKKENFHLCFSAGIARKDIWKKDREKRKLAEQKKIAKVLSLDTYKNVNFDKLTDQELLKYRNRVKADKDYIADRYMARKVSIDDLNKIQAKVIEINKPLYNRGFCILR